jgi:outer membrane protein TolC
MARISLLLTLAVLPGCFPQRLLGTVNGPPTDPGALGAPTLPCREPALLGGEPPAPPCPQDAPPAVSTVLTPEGPGREISLMECIALALENGRTGEFYDVGGGGRATSAGGVQPQGPLVAFTDSIRVFAYDPAIVGTQTEQALSRFDVLWQTSFLYDHFDRPPGLDLLGIFPPGFNNPTVQNILAILGGFFNTFGQFDTAQFRTELLKPLPTGGLAGITFRTDYFAVPNTINLGLPLNLPPVSVPVPFVFSPAYRPAVDFTFEQPLLRGAGVWINQLRDTHPGSVRNLGLAGGQAPGILLARISHNEARLEFERRVHELLFRVEEAYWGLYSAYWELYSREAGLKQAHAAWQVAKERYDRGGLDLEDLAQVEDQYQNFRAQRLQALGRGTPGRPGVLEAERRLRYLVGLPAEDGTRLIPSDHPVDAPYLPDWGAAVAEARARRPELLQIQQEIQAAELVVRKAKDLLLPDLRFLAKYNVNGLGHTLGAGLDVLGQNRFNDWELGLLLQVPVGFRDANAQTARARLQLAQRFAFLHDQQSKVILSLQRSYREVVQFSEEFRIRRSRREAAATQLKARTAKYRAGRETIDFLLTAQRNWTDALRDEYVALCNYNVALADYERQKGTILQFDNVTVMEGSIPAYAQARASEHIRERQRALLLRERSADWPNLRQRLGPDRGCDALDPTGRPCGRGLPGEMHQPHTPGAREQPPTP